MDRQLIDVWYLTDALSMLASKEAEEGTIIPLDASIQFVGLSHYFEIKSIKRLSSYKVGKEAWHRVEYLQGSVLVYVSFCARNKKSRRTLQIVLEALVQPDDNGNGHPEIPPKTSHFSRDTPAYNISKLPRAVMKFLRRLVSFNDDDQSTQLQSNGINPYLRLADPRYSAYKEIMEVAAIVDSSVQLQSEGLFQWRGKIINLESLKRAVFLLQKAITLSANDPDLLLSQVILQQHTLGTVDTTLLERVLEIESQHFEARMLHSYGDRWHTMLDFPGWDERQRQLHPMMMEHLRHGHRVQIVRCGLQKVLAVVTGVRGGAFATETEVSVQWRFSKTPYGPLVAYYLTLQEPHQESSVMEGFVPLFEPAFSSPMEGYLLIQQAAFRPAGFVIAVDGEKVVFNRLIPFKAQQLQTVVEQISDLSIYLRRDQFQDAMQWHINNFDLSKLA